MIKEQFSRPRNEELIQYLKFHGFYCDDGIQSLWYMKYKIIPMLYIGFISKTKNLIYLKNWFIRSDDYKKFKQIISDYPEVVTITNYE